MLRRAAFSPNIKERADCSAALFTPDGELLVQAEHIPVHLGSMPASVRGGHRRRHRPRARGPGRPQRSLRRRHPPERPDPRGPLLRRRPLIGWVANRAHHADLGGMAPGSIPPDAVEIFQEGLRLPPDAADRRRWPPSSSPTPGPPRSGGATSTPSSAPTWSACERLAAFAGAPLDQVTAYGERRMRAALRRLARRALACRGRPRLRRAPPGSSSVRSTIRLRPDQGRRTAIALRLQRDRSPAAGQRQRGRGGDRQRGRLRRALGDRPHHPGQRRRPAAGAGDRPARHASSPPSRPRRSAPATSRSPSGSPTSACGPWPRPPPDGWPPAARGP